MRRKTAVLVCLLLSLLLVLSVGLSAGCSLTPNRASSTDSTTAPKTPSTMKEMLQDLESRVAYIQSAQQDQSITNRNITESLAAIQKQLSDIQKQLSQNQ